MAEPVLFKDGRAAWSTGTATGELTQISGIKSVELPLTKAELANSVMSDVAETFFPGLISSPITVVARQDFTTGGVDDEVYGRWNSETAFHFEAAAVNATISTTNPAYRFNHVRVFAHTPISGAHGVLLENSFQLRMQSGCTVTRLTST